MRRVLKFSLYTVSSGAALGGYVYYATRPDQYAPPLYKGREMNAEEWNAVQDQDAINRGFESLTHLRNSGVMLNWLYGCPYCARVKAMLDFHDVPYQPIDVDPINFQQLNAIPYKSCPQLQLLHPPGGPPKENPEFGITKLGPMVVDSDVIIKRIAGTAKLDMESPTIVQGRDWITNNVARLVFVTGSSTVGRAYSLTQYVTPDKYHGFIFRAGAAVPMWLLATKKIAGRLEKQYQEAGDKAPAGVQQILAEGTFTADKADRVLVEELRAYGAKISPYHGGKKPDVVDIELYGLLRSQAKHKPIKQCVREAGLADWYREMKQLTRSSALTERIGA